MLLPLIFLISFILSSFAIPLDESIGESAQRRSFQKRKNGRAIKTTTVKSLAKSTTKTGKSIVKSPGKSSGTTTKVSKTSAKTIKSTIKSTTTLAQPPVITVPVDKNAWIKAHDQRRKNVALGGGPSWPSMKWSEELAKAALWHATEATTKCTFGQARYLYNYPIYYGENVLGTVDVSPTNPKIPMRSPENVLKLWTEDEKSNYDSKTKLCKPGTNCFDYTQVMWKGSEWLGCATVRSTKCRGKLIKNWGKTPMDSMASFELSVCYYVRPGNCLNNDFTLSKLSGYKCDFGCVNATNPILGIGGGDLMEGYWETKLPVRLGKMYGSTNYPSLHCNPSPMDPKIYYAEP